MAWTVEGRGSIDAAMAIALSRPFAGGSTLADVERQWILATRERCGGNQREAAEALGTDRSTLYRKLRQYRA